MGEKGGSEAQGRDYRCVSEHGREMWAPFLDESVHSFIRSQPIDAVREGESCDGLDYGLFPPSRGRRQAGAAHDRQTTGAVVSRFLEQEGDSVWQSHCEVGAVRGIPRRQYNSFMKKSTHRSKGDDVYVAMSSLS